MVFVDESGKSGTIRFEAGEWNDGGCPCLVIAAVVLPDEKIPILEAEIDSIVRKYNIQAREIKSTHKTVIRHQDEIMSALDDFFRAENGLAIVEASMKKYNICMTITDYCAYPYYDIRPEEAFSPDTRLMMMTFANFFAETLSDELLGEAVKFFDENSQDINGLICLCRKIIAAIDNGSQASQQVITCIEYTIDSINKYSSRRLSVSNLFPLPDSYNGGFNNVAVCPQINCLNGIFARTKTEKNYRLDKMSDLSGAITLNASENEKLFGRNLSVEFCDSKREKGIQAADFIAGAVRRYVENLLGINSGSPVKLPGSLRYQINFVGTFREQLKIHRSNSWLKQQAEYYELWKNS